MLRIAGKIFVDADEWSDQLKENARLKQQVNRLTRELEDSRNYDFWKDSMYSLFHGLYYRLFELTVDTFEQLEPLECNSAVRLPILNRFYDKAFRSVMDTHKETVKNKKTIS